jgi:CRISPR/Cas system-associated protein Cas10 (large subunit of type III CRISPR-Cas system)
MDGPGEDADDADPLEVALALLERLEHAELSVKETMDRIEAITEEPTLQRQILEEAERRGIIDRDGPVVYPQGAAFVRFESDVITKEGEFSCERCGADLSTGYFIDLDPGEVGPYGSTCIRKVTGRE